MTLSPGQNIGPYRILEQIGRGGMAVVYKAHQAALARYVAIKVLPAYLAEDPAFRERFQAEAVTIAKLRHPNILQVYDFGDDGGTFYIVTEFVDGGTLSEQLGSPLPVDYVTRVLAPIASALDYAHAREVLHRDVKPSNILLARDGTPVMSDFGLARMMGSVGRLTRTDAVVGTPEYMAPEQAAGEDAAPAADRYALAIVAYEMLVGSVPYSADTPLATLIAHLHKPLPLPTARNPHVLPAVESVLLKGLAKEPAARYETASGFVRALDAAERGPVAPAIAATPAAAAAPLVVPEPTALPLGAVVPASAPSATTATRPAGPSRLIPISVVAAAVLLLGLVAGAVALTRGTQVTPTASADTAAALPSPATTSRSIVPATATATARPTPSPTAFPHGALVFEAKPDASGSEFSVRESNVGGRPDRSAGEIRPHDGSIDLAVTAARGQIGVLFTRAVPGRYLGEVDVTLRPTAVGFTFVWRVSIASGQCPCAEHVLIVSPQDETLRLRYTTEGGGQPIGSPVSLPPGSGGLFSGKEARLGFLRDGPKYVILVDGIAVAEGNDDRLSPPGAFFFRVFEQGVVTIRAIRVYAVD